MTFTHDFFQTMRVCKTDIGENGTRQQVLRQGGGEGGERGEGGEGGEAGKGGKEGVGAGGGEGEQHGFTGWSNSVNPKQAVFLP